MFEVEAGAKTIIRFTLNGKPVQAEAETRMQLADLLRHVLKQYGTHVGCEHGILRSVHGAGRWACGQIVFDVCRASRGCCGDHRRRPCWRPWRTERFAVGVPKASRAAMRICTPGILASATQFLSERVDADVREIRDMLSGHICRCTGYTAIVEAISATAKNRKAQSTSRLQRRKTDDRLPE